MNKEALESLKKLKEMFELVYRYESEYFNKSYQIVEQALTADRTLEIVKKYRNIEVEKFENNGASHNYHNITLLNEIISESEGTENEN
jgi:hypothetical protein